MSDDVEVALEIDGVTVALGVAYVLTRRKVTTTDFAYDTGFLGNPDAYAVDPALPLDTGRGFVQGLPGAFADCTPDRWGKRLIERRIRMEEGPGAPRFITDVDYLLGVSDTTRQGALRFRLRGTTAYADPAPDVPKLVDLPELLGAADRVALDATADPEDFSAIKILLDAGTGTLGGARPKASVRDDDGELQIAKFPHPHDSWDVMAWEKTALDLAERAGIDVPTRTMVRLDRRSVLLLTRFDRRGDQRVGYMSAMTLVQGRDGGGSGAQDYLELAAELAEVSAAADDDLEALWRRIAFSVAIHNTDDHFRNHGLLRERHGWRLSPAFDINPNPDVAEERATGIGGATARPDAVDALMAIAADLGLSERQAQKILADVLEATRAWRDVAIANGAPDSEIQRFEPAFEGLRGELATRSVRAQTTPAPTSRRRRSGPVSTLPRLDSNQQPSG